MLIAAVAMATMLGWAPDDGPGPEELVARLGAPRYADRETAAEALRQMGDRALPALRKARSARDLESGAGRRSSATRSSPSRSSSRPWSGSTFMTARFPRWSRKSVGEPGSPSPRSTSHRFTGSPATDPPGPIGGSRSSPPDPLPFWEAIDRLCRAGGLRRMFPQQFYGPDEPFDRLTLVPGAGVAPEG